MGWQSEAVYFQPDPLLPLRTCRRTVPQPFSHVTTKHLHLCAVAFLNSQQDPSPGQKAQPSTCTWKLWSRQFLTQKLPKNKVKDLAAVNKEQFMLFLLASTFVVPHETYLGNMNCLLSAWTFPKLTSLQHDRLNVPQTVGKESPGGGQWL